MGNQFLHTMVRVADMEASTKFYCDLLDLKVVRQVESEKGRYTNTFLATEDDVKAFGDAAPSIELTFNWDPEAYTGGRNFGHLAYRVDNIYETCQKLMDAGVVINRPPRDGHMAFVRSPDNISIELLQRGDSLPSAEPWASMPNTGEW